MMRYNSWIKFSKSDKVLLDVIDLDPPSDSEQELESNKDKLRDEVSKADSLKSRTINSVNCFGQDKNLSSAKSRLSAISESAKSVSNKEDGVETASSDSETDDDGIQVVDDKTVKEPLTVVNLDSSSDSESDDDVVLASDPIKKTVKAPIEVIDLNPSSDSELELDSNSFKLKDKVVPAKPKVSDLKKPVTKSKVSVIKESSKGTKNLSKFLSSDSESSSDEEQGPMDVSLNGDWTLSTCHKPAWLRKPLPRSLSKDWFDSVSVEPVRVKGWTDEMHAFYHDIDYDQVDLTLDQILAKMPDDPDLWHVSAQDRYAQRNGNAGTPRSRSRYFARNTRCHNCNRLGHPAKDCTEKERPKVCYMCGGPDHVSDNCPDAKCLRCGALDSYYSNDGCTNCKRLAHADCFNCGGRGPH